MSWYTFFGAILAILTLYVGIYIVLSQRVKKVESQILDIFFQKVAKIPALIEVMRPYIARHEAFDPLIHLHTGIMIEEVRSIYDLLEHNARMQKEFLFLMQLSTQVPELQKHEYFLYIRDFIIEYERRMRSQYVQINRGTHAWNTFIRYKNYTIIGYLLPGSSRSDIV